MTENISINETEFIIDWRNGYIMIIDLEKNQYIRLYIDEVDWDITQLLEKLLFREVVKSALKIEIWNPLA